MDKQKNSPGNGECTLHIKPRYYRLCTDPGIVESEKNFRYAYLDWHLPITEFALVCVDVWNGHYAADTHERTDRITREKIRPLVQQCREAGIKVIHAPAPPLANRHPNWVRLVPDWEHPHPEFPGSPDDWPPRDFIEKKGSYSQYARPVEPRITERVGNRDQQRQFHPDIFPKGDEAVIVNGEELHRYCRQHEILQLFFVGFNTNACMVLRNYAPYAMNRRGYDCILVRDCTTGMETHETQAGMICTRGTIASFEQFGIYTVTSAEMMNAIRLH